MTAGSKFSIHAIILAILLAIAAAFAQHGNNPGVLSPYTHSLILDAGINIILAVSLNLILGITGQFSLGHAGFLAAGAYAAALVAGSAIGPQLHFWHEMLHFSIGCSLHLMMLCGIAAGMIVAAILGLIVGLPTLRLRGDYLAIATLGFGEILAVVIQNSDALGGSTGYSVDSARQEWMGNAVNSAGDPTPLAQQLSDFLNGNFYSVGLFFVFAGVILTIAIVRNIKYSTEGRALQAIREDIIASESVGIPTTRYKVAAFVIGAALAGLAGGLLSHHKSLNPESFKWTRSIEVVAMVILGGQGSITGSIVAAIALTFLPEELRGSQTLQSVALKFGISADQWDDLVIKWRMVIYSLAIILSMLLRPQGIFGGHEITDLVARWEKKASRKKEYTAEKPQAELLSSFGVSHPAFSPGSPILQCNNLAMSFGGLRAVDDFNLQMQAGELVGLIGPNGAGKTTIFNMLTGVYRPTQGEIMLGNRRITGLRPHRIATAGMARTFQNIRLFGNLTVLENVQIAQHAVQRHGLPTAILRTPTFYRQEAQSAQTAISFLRLMNLESLAAERAASLSYGDQRRLEIVRALATRPKLLLLDEPAAGMNPTEKRHLMEIIRRLRDEFSITVLLIEHDMKVIMGICERIIVLDYGKQIAQGVPLEIRKNPAVIEAYLGASTKHV